MRSLVLLAVLLGLDNLRVTVALGISGVTTAVQRRLAAGFGVAESGAVLIGFAVGSAVAADADALAGAVMLVAAVLALAAVVRGTNVNRWLARRWVIVLLPASLAADNVAAGVGLGATGEALLVAAVVGLASAGWSVFGLHLGGLLHTHRRLATLVAATLVVTAIPAIFA
jgi:putative Mn2+ efflux pump MntP